MAEGRGDAVTRIVHIVPGVDDASNGMAVVAKLLAEEQGDAVVADLSRAARVSLAGGVEEVWVHGLWLPCIWLACLRILASGRRLVRMPHGSLGPIYLKKQSPALKRLVGPIERWLLRRSDRVVVTCEAERGWVRDYLGANRPRVEMTDLKRFFKLDGAACAMRGKTAPLHVMYLGRRHPQKGLEYLEEAADGMDGVELHEECGVSGGAKDSALLRAPRAHGLKCTYSRRIHLHTDRFHIPPVSGPVNIFFRTTDQYRVANSFKFMVCRSRDMDRARDLPDLSVFPLQTFRADRPVRQMGASDFYKNLFHPLLVPLMIR